jgi:hypothetical protein
MINVRRPTHESREIEGRSAKYEGSFGIVREVSLGPGVYVRSVEETLVFDKIYGDIGIGQSRFHQSRIAELGANPDAKFTCDGFALETIE